MNSLKVNVWCELSTNKLIGSFFFDDDIINRENYLAMLQSFFASALRRLKNVRSIIFQQDGAPLHFSRDVRQFLDQNFPARWIGAKNRKKILSNVFSNILKRMTLCVSVDGDHLEHLL